LSRALLHPYSFPTRRSSDLQNNMMELVLGTKSRSGGQWDIWEAVFSPVGPDGYPKRIWDKRTGEVDRTVAAYWREHYDLVHIMRSEEHTSELQSRVDLVCRL